ncbi:hypothetical protein AM1_C0310 (plasmid) [Acaryochloris marina MBIC11017]|uniref:Uncharacterized protein n=1 Tax=Acaryochloris marina (strain MBIC 11017) TaxID=329726 RepID=A8ZN39_ACAM1|nr:hypothetical protein AM1_C0310 [Acaryochloris marina MBIC11017]
MIQQAFELFWAEQPDDVSDCQLAKSRMTWCEGRGCNSCGKGDSYLENHPSRQ